MAEARRLEDASETRRARGLPDDEQAAWREFTEATTVEEFCRGWLAVQCRLVAGAVGAVAYRAGTRDEPALSRIAVWGSAGAAEAALRDAAQRALGRQERVLVHHQTDTGRRHAVAFPIHAGSQVFGAVAVDLALRPAPELQAVLRQLEWGSGWLEALAQREAPPDARAPRRAPLEQVLDLVASAQGHARFSDAATAFATELATRLGCDRVSLGFVRRGRAEVCVVSHTAHLDDRTNLVRAIGAAMDEALDQKASVAWPPGVEAVSHVSRAHERLAQQSGPGSVLTVPIASAERFVGALTLERAGDRPFDRGTLDLVEAVLALAGPWLDLLRREDRGLPAKAADSLRQWLERLLGPGQAARKLGAVAALAAIAFLAFAKGDYRVSARAVMEGDVRRSAAAPFAGYLREAPARAGDVVRKGQALAVLDDRELRLERAKLESERDQFDRQRILALARGNAAEMNIARAQADQAAARLALVEDQLQKTRIVAGFDGIVVTGDLSQSVGAPVEKGQVLFEVAPLDAYRVMLEVDERDIADVATGQRGGLRLVSEPGESVPFTIEKIVPVSIAKDGRNFFRAEARVERTPERLRPGMEGVAKIDVDRRHLAAVWTRALVDWARLAVWTWAP